jgi:hypothetical protein
MLLPVTHTLVLTFKGDCFQKVFDWRVSPLLASRREVGVASRQTGEGRVDTLKKCLTAVPVPPHLLLTWRRDGG